MGNTKASVVRFEDLPKNTPVSHQSSSGNLYRLKTGMRLGNLHPILAQSLQMKLDGFTDEADNFHATLGRRDTTWQIGNIGTKTGGTLFNDDRVTHGAIL
jgi:hypothetical protein